MATLSAIRTALQVRLATLPTTTVYATVPTNWEPQTGGAAVAIEPNALSELVSFSGQRDWTFKAHILVRANGPDRGQSTLDAYKSPTGTQSVEACIDADPHLGGVVEYAWVDGWTDYGGLVQEGSQEGLLGGTVEIKVWTA